MEKMKSLNFAKKLEQRRRGGGLQGEGWGWVILLEGYEIIRGIDKVDRNKYFSLAKMS